MNAQPGFTRAGCCKKRNDVRHMQAKFYPINSTGPAGLNAYKKAQVCFTDGLQHPSNTNRNLHSPTNRTSAPRSTQRAGNSNLSGTPIPSEGMGPGAGGSGVVGGKGGGFVLPLQSLQGEVPKNGPLGDV